VAEHHGGRQEYRHDHHPTDQRKRPPRSGSRLRRVHLAPTHQTVHGVARTAGILDVGLSGEEPVSPGSLEVVRDDVVADLCGRHRRAQADVALTADDAHHAPIR
jgi:hypothetical protein